MLTTYGVLFIFENIQNSNVESINISIIDQSIYLIQGKNIAKLNERIIEHFTNLINDNTQICIVFGASNNNSYEVEPELNINLTPKDIIQLATEYAAQKTALEFQK